MSSPSRRRPGPAGEDRMRLDVFQHLFAAAAEEMGASLLRSSFSPNIRERRDFSCALFDHAGRMIGQAAHLPVHLGSTPMSVQAAIERVPMRGGDAVILNDPYAGGTHLPDITLVSPVFLSRGRRPDFYCANRAHHADVGGAEPGSMAPATDVHGEGIRIPPIKLVEGGELRRDVLQLLLANMRVPREREGDLLAQWATNGIGAQRLLEMAREHGAAEVRARAAGLMDWTERLTRELIAGLPRGRASFEDELEEPLDLRDPSRTAKLRLTVESSGTGLVFDFRASDALSRSSLNATRAVTVSAVFYVLRTLLPAGTPTNDGILRPVRVLTTPGTLVDAAYPSGVAAGNVETSQRLVDVLFGALAKLLPARIPAASAGTMSNFTVGGLAANGEPFAYYETIAGGAGASPLGTGASALQTHMTNTRNTPIEALENALPLRVTALSVRRGSGGVGARSGGDGVEKRVRFLDDADVAFIGERQTCGPYGLEGGGRGSCGSVELIHPDGRVEPLPGKTSRHLPPDTELLIKTPGGGAHGAPPH